MLFLYTLLLKFVNNILQVLAFFYPKIKKGVVGRAETFGIIATKRDFSKKLVWFHAASLGEFEQGRPLIEKIKSQRPDYQVLLTFFSPSGYEIRKDYPHADIICYLPLDIPKNVKQFYDLAQPDFIFFIKYEFWYFFLLEAIKRNIPTAYVAATFRKNQYFFKWYGKKMRNDVLKKINYFFVQEKKSADLLRHHGIVKNVIVAGDPRIDRVAAIAANAPTFPIIEKFLQGKKAIVVGSSWQQDIAILMPFINLHSKYKIIIAPHEINEKNIQFIENECIKTSMRYSKPNYDIGAALLIIDNVGMLSAIYQYAHIAYIGGGFGAGIHNTLEPMAFGIPIVFGPKYKKFAEANAMTSANPKGAFSVRSTADVKRIFEFLADEENYQTAADQTKNYIEKNIGATDMIFETLDMR
jgi:3-deoxy-D-manno-octulosonic-acid transferase